MNREQIYTHLQGSVIVPESRLIIFDSDAREPTTVGSHATENFSNFGL